MTKKRTLQGLAIGFIVISLIATGFAQPTRPADGEGGGRRRGGGFGGRGGDPAQFRQQMMERMKEQLAVADQDWKIVEPRLNKVFGLQQEVAGGARGGFGAFPGRRGGGRGGFGGPPQGDDARELNPTETASQALREILEQDDASADQIKAKLTALRAAKESARQKLASAQKELREVLTLKQEAQLVLMGQLN